MVPPSSSWFTYADPAVKASIASSADSPCCGSSADTMDQAFRLDDPALGGQVQGPAQAGTYAEEYPSLARALGETDRQAVNDDAFETSLRLILTELGAELSEASGLGSLRARNQRKPAGSVVL